MAKEVREKQHRFETNKKYYTISIYAVAVILLCAAIAKLIFSWSTTSELIGKYVSALYPIIFGFLIAYMLNPLSNLFERKIFGKIIPGKGLCRALGIIISYVILIGMLVIVVVFLAPQLYASGVDLIDKVEEWYSDPTSAGWVISLQEQLPKIDVTGMMENFKEAVVSFLDSGELGQNIYSWMPRIFSTAGALFTILYNIVFSFIVSVYVLIDKKRIILNIKRLVRASFNSDRAHAVNKVLKQTHGIFCGFIIGKTVDSLIIGSMCFVFMSIFGLPYALLISLIVGITNMIPYVGPFVGAIPGFVIILMLDPIQSVIYMVLVLALQWFDGFYLGPKILGVSTGLRPVWIIFALCVGGAAAGIMGMFLGVPFVASVALLIDQWIDRRLVAKKIELGETKIVDVKTEEKEVAVDKASEEANSTSEKEDKTE